MNRNEPQKEIDADYLEHYFTYVKTNSLSDKTQMSLYIYFINISIYLIHQANLFVSMNIHFLFI